MRIDEPTSALPYILDIRFLSCDFARVAAPCLISSCCLLTDSDLVDCVKAIIENLAKKGAKLKQSIKITGIKMVFKSKSSFFLSFF